MQTQELILAEKKSTEDPVVEIRGLCKCFGQTEILKQVSIELKKGENLVVLGKSGSGKSTLIKCLIGLEEPDSGTIAIFGQNMSDLSESEWNPIRLRMGFLFQGAALFDSMSVWENLRFPLKRHRKDLRREEMNRLILEALDQVGLQEAVDKMPAELSGGMSKRIGLARALILKPEIMLYDEPTSGLDTATSKEISQLILDMQEKNRISSIIITHDMACAKMTADRIFILKDGSILASGSYESLEQSEDEWVKSFFT